MIEQKQIQIAGITIPVIIEDGIRWFPMKRLCRDILLRGSLCSEKEIKNKYHKYIRPFDIKYTANQPVKSTICICENGLIEILVKTKINKLTIEEIKNQNVLHTFLGILPIHITEKDKKQLKKQRKKSIKWSKHKIKQYIRKRYDNGLSLSSASVQGEFRQLHEAAIKYYGSWEQTINAILNIDYDEIREDIDLMKYYGLKFEKLLGDIIKEVSGDFVKGYNQYLKPDFVIGSTWIDAKLSHWTASIPETIEKYEPFCDYLMIIFLRGNRTLDKMVTNKTRILSVYTYIKLLSEERQEYFIKLLDELYERINEQEKTIKLAEIV